MSVFVDRLRACVPNGRWRWTRSCHLTADTEDELHRFASRLGLRREWFQAGRAFHSPRLSRYILGHYDLNPARRTAALRLGAVEQDPREGATWEFPCMQSLPSVDTPARVCRPSSLRLPSRAAWIATSV